MQLIYNFFFPSLHNLLRLLHISRERSGFLEYFILLITSWDVLGEFWSNSDSESRSVVSDSLRPHGLYSPRNSPGQNTGVGGLPLLQGIFPTQGSNPGLPHCRRILHQLGHKGSPRILKWIAYSFSRDLPNPGIKPGSPALQADSLLTELSGKPYTKG